MEERMVFKDSDGNKVVGILSKPTESKERITILCHGFSSGKDRPSSVAVSRVIESCGVPTLRFDFFGHGESEGKFEEITISRAVDDILNAIRFVESKGYKRIALFCSSFGGISSIMAASKTDRLAVLILKSPVSDYEEEERKAKGNKGIEEWKRRGYAFEEASEGSKLRLNYSFFEDFRNNNGYKAAEKIEIPTLIIHGDHDKEVPIEQSLKTSKLIRNCELHVVRGADHRYTNPAHFEEMLQTIKEFIKKNFG